MITDPTGSETPCDSGVHVLCCHPCSCDCHEDDGENSAMQGRLQ